MANLFADFLLANSVKVLLMPILYGLLWVTASGTPAISSKLFKWTSFALFFSWMGDILLIFQGSNAIYFLLGLSAFLIAHISYIAVFRVSRNPEPGMKFKSWLLPISLLSIYLVFLFAGIGPGLHEYTVPVILYTAAISGMLLSAFSRSGGTVRQSFVLVLTGATLFILSDSMIAINKFWMPIADAGAWIMLTYGSAQYLIIRGLISHMKPGK